jgi:RimJ/RimL family protein N-acetyltransferase
MWGDPSVTKYIGGRPFSREEVWARLLRYAGHWEWMGYGFWLIEEIRTKRFVGEVGMADFKRDLEPPLNQGIEVGWALATDAHGLGYATEALMAVIKWQQSQAFARGLCCLIHPDNTASIRLATKCGFDELRRTFYKGHLTTVMARPPQDATQAFAVSS